MSNLAMKIKEQRRAEQKQSTKQTVIVKRRGSVTLGEKFLIIVFVSLLILGALKIIANSYASYQTSIEIQKIEAKIQKQEKVNNDLYVQVEELSKPERIWEKAKELGLSLDENNVKSVRD